MKKNKKLLILLEKYKKSEDMEAFKSEYNDMFPINVKYTNPFDLESCFSQEMAAAIDRNIILDLIWMSKSQFLKNGLIEEKLRRILDEE